MNDKIIVDPVELHDEKIKVDEIENNIIVLNNNIIDDLKNNLTLYNISYYINNEILNDKFDDNVEFIIDDEIFIDVENDIEFIKNLSVLSCINYFKGSIINNDVIDKIRYYTYLRFININNEFVKNLIYDKNKNKYSIYKINELIEINVNYNIINLIYKLLNENDIEIDDVEIDDDVEIINEFLIDQYDIIDDVLLIHYNNNIVDNYNMIINCISIYDENEIIYDIDELFDIDNRLCHYINYDMIIDDLIIDGYYYEFKNYYIHNGYF